MQMDGNGGLLINKVQWMVFMREVIIIEKLFQIDHVFFSIQFLGARYLNSMFEHVECGRHAF
jgi:hypothetical protein